MSESTIVPSDIPTIYNAANDPNSPIGQMYATAGITMPGAIPGMGSPTNAQLASDNIIQRGRNAGAISAVGPQYNISPQQQAYQDAITRINWSQPNSFDKFMSVATPLLTAAGLGAAFGPAVGQLAGVGGGAAGGGTLGVEGTTLAATAAPSVGSLAAQGAITGAISGGSGAGLTGQNIGQGALLGAVGGGLGGALRPVVGGLTSAGIPAPIASGIVKVGSGALTGALSGAISGKGAGAGAAQGALSAGSSVLQSSLLSGLGNLLSGSTAATPDAPLGNSGPPTADEIANLTSGATTGDNSLASLSAGNLDSLPFPDPLTYAPGVDPYTSDNGGFIAPPSGISNAPMADDTLDLNNIFDNSNTSNDTTGGASGNGNSVEMPGSGMPTADDIAALTGGATTGDNSLTNLAAGDLNSGSNPGFDPLSTNIGGQSVGITPNINLGSLLGKLLGGSGGGGNGTTSGNGTATGSMGGANGSLLGRLAGLLGGSGGNTGLLSQLLGLGANAGSNILNSDAAKSAAGNFAGQTKFAPYGVSTNNGSTSFNGTNATSALSPGQQAVSNGITGMNTSALANLAAGPGAAQTANFNALTSSQFDAQKRLLGNTQDNEFANGILGSTAGGYQTQGAMNAIGSQISGDQVTAANMANTQQQQQLAQLTAGLNGSNTINSSQLQQILAGAGIGGTASGANSVAYRPQLSTNANSNIGNILGSLANTQGPF